MGFSTGQFMAHNLLIKIRLWRIKFRELVTDSDNKLLLEGPKT